MESTLNLNYGDFIAKTGIFLGWGRGAAFGDTAYTSQQQYLLDEFVQSAIRAFYVPNPPYDWSFLHPLYTTILPAGNNIIQLPDDCGGLEGYLTVVSSATANTQTIVPWAVRRHNEGEIREKFACNPGLQGPPMMFAVLMDKGKTQYSSNRQRLIFYPIPDNSYTVQFQYYIIDQALTGSNPYVYGGALHAETILQGCLAKAEQKMDSVIGIQTALYQERLQASIGQDRKFKPETVGYNRDDSDNMNVGRPWKYAAIGAATYKGSPYD